MYSEEAEARAERQKVLEQEREKIAMSLGDTSKRVKKYNRMKRKSKLKGVKDKKLRSHLSKVNVEAEQAAKKAARMELLLQEEPGCLEAEGMEKTTQFRQEDIAAAVPLAASSQYFNLTLDVFGPYAIDYSRHGGQLLIGGRKGHLASMDWRDKRLCCEFHVRETVRDVQFLHNEMLFAVAQKRHLYIYDHTGMELHCLKGQHFVNQLTFLPHHHLLVSADEHGNLHYLDSSMGKMVAVHRTKLGALKTLTHNPHNAIVQLGHHNGTVTLWSPNVSSPLVKMLCHRGPVLALAVDGGGRFMVTSGMDARVKVWDLRGYRMLHEYCTGRPVGCLDVSQRGMVAMGKGRGVEVWRDALREKQRMPYLRHQVCGDVSCLQFVPFEDCLGIGHEKGFTSIIVPGAGEANFDALEANPFQSKRQRREMEVKQLLEKVPAELITLDPDQVARVDVESEEEEAGKDEGVIKRRQTREEKGRQLRKAQVREKEREEREEKQEQRNKRKGILDRFR